MLQRTFALRTENDFDEMVSKIRNDPAYVRVATKAMIIYTTQMKAEVIEEHLRNLKKMLPDLITFGITLLCHITDMFKQEDLTICSLLMFDSSQVRVFTYDCHLMTPTQAGMSFVEDTKGIPDLRGVFVASSDRSMTPGDFLNVVSRCYPSVPLFGAQAGVQDLSDLGSLVFCGTRVWTRACLAVAFSGRDLNIYARENLGWKMLGRTHEITKIGEKGRVIEIDNEPAFQLYSRYLDFKTREDFFDNSNLFPLVEMLGKLPAARVPYTCGEDGSIYFHMHMSEGTEVSLSYSRAEYMLKDTVRSANELEKFRPQAILLILCRNRELLLKEEDLGREGGYFRRIIPDTCWGYGDSEILMQYGDGGILNSSMVIVGMREGSNEGFSAPVITDPELERTGEEVSMIDRLVMLLEKTTRELRELAVKDQLTGAANRWRLKEEIDFLQQSGTPWSALMFDIDHFKEVNDTWGHQAGDQALVEITNLVRTMVRDDDLITRWGGEEFIVIFRNINLNRAKEIAERIRAGIEAHTFETVRHITVSIGVTAARHTDSQDSVVGRLDRALYTSKESGRNTVTVLA